jgi:hypothetical protein
MKRLVWSLMMSVAAVALLLSSPGAHAHGQDPEFCWEIECTRGTQCDATCPTCNGDTFEPGTCWYT